MYTFRDILTILSILLQGECSDYAPYYPTTHFRYMCCRISKLRPEHSWNGDNFRVSFHMTFVPLIFKVFLQELRFYTICRYSCSVQPPISILEYTTTVANPMVNAITHLVASQAGMPYAPQRVIGRLVLCGAPIQLKMEELTSFSTPILSTATDDEPKGSLYFYTLCSLFLPLCQIAQHI
jgi:hypothetical protein